MKDKYMQGAHPQMRSDHHQYLGIIADRLVEGLDIKGWELSPLEEQDSCSVLSIYKLLFLLNTFITPALSADMGLETLSRPRDCRRK